MLSFRPLPPLPPDPGPLALLAVGRVIDAAMRPGHWFVAPGLSLEWSGPAAETIPWETFRGRLVERRLCRGQRTFLSWHVYERTAEGPPEEPLFSVKLDVHTRRLHVVRGLLCHVWEGYGDGGEVQAREVARWVRELVGTIAVDQFRSAEELCDELICLLWQAVVGTSRLPLHSVEAPLPAFTLGRLHYVYREDVTDADAPLASWQDLVDRGLGAALGGGEEVKLLELVLRHVAADDVPAVADRFVRCRAEHGRPPAEPSRLLRSLFNDVSLSPYTGLVDNALAFAAALVEQGCLSVEQHVDFLGFLLRQTGRHLTAYDLVTFHHRGANYPDALLLDAVLRAYVALVEGNPALVLGGGESHLRRRRALRQGVLLRRRYEGHLVPDQPTSPGENARVLPAPHTRVPEEQLLQPLRRSRRLFAGVPTVRLLGPRAREAFVESLSDLAHASECAELGTAVFIDRPLGYAKEAAEPDQTPLLAHEAYSPSIAARRLRELAQLAGELGQKVADIERRTPPPARGLPHAELAEPARPTASLADVRRVADDFVIVRTLSRGLAELHRCVALPVPPQHIRLLVMRKASCGPPRLTAHDADYCPLASLDVDTSAGWLQRAGLEWPAAGLRVVGE